MGEPQEGHWKVGDGEQSFTMNTLSAACPCTHFEIFTPGPVFIFTKWKKIKSLNINRMLTEHWANVFERLFNVELIIKVIDSQILKFSLNISLTPKSFHGAISKGYNELFLLNIDNYRCFFPQKIKSCHFSSCLPAADIT